MYWMKIMTVIRGLWMTIWLRMKGIRVGSGFRTGRHCRFLTRGGGKISIGRGVLIGDGVTISAIQGGTVEIGDGVGVGEYSRIMAHQKIEIRKGCNIAPHVYFYDHDHVFDASGVHRYEYINGSISVGADSWIGTNTVILRDTEIGDGCLIGAGSVVKGSFPAHSKVVQKRTTEVREI